MLDEEHMFDVCFVFLLPTLAIKSCIDGNSMEETETPKQLQTISEVNIPYVPKKYAQGYRLTGISWILAASLCTLICWKTSKMLGRAAMEASTKYDTDNLLTCQRVAAVLTIILALSSVITAGYWMPSIINPESTAVYQTWKD